MDELISQNGENAVNKIHGKSNTPRKVGFRYYCQVFYPNGKMKYKVTQKTRTMKISFSMTSGDRTIIFMLSLLGLSSKQPVPRKSNPVQQKPKEDIISPLEPLLLQQKKLNDLLICFFFIYIFVFR